MSTVYYTQLGNAGLPGSPAVARLFSLQDSVHSRPSSKHFDMMFLCLTNF